MHTAETTTAKIFQIISDVTGHPIEVLKTENHLHNDLGLDSMDILTIGCEIEKAYEITFPDDEIENATTIQRLVNMTMGKLNPAE
jgi:acyl carrier protein